MKTFNNVEKRRITIWNLTKSLGLDLFNFVFKYSIPKIECNQREAYGEGEEREENIKKKKR